MFRLEKKNTKNRDEIKQEEFMENELEKKGKREGETQGTSSERQKKGRRKR